MLGDSVFVNNPDVIVAHTKNVVVMQQVTFLDSEVETVCIATKTKGYVAVGKRTLRGTYETIGAYAIDKSCAVSFKVPVGCHTKFDRVSWEILNERYQDEKELWETIQAGTR